MLVFFAVSGLLIRRSWEYDPSPARLLDQACAATAPRPRRRGRCTAFVLGPLVTTRQLATYFSSWETWVYPLRVTCLVPFGARLPGVFDDNLLRRCG